MAFIVLFYAGVAISRVHQAMAAGNFALSNFRLLLVLTVTKVALLSGLLWAAWRARSRRSAAGSLSTAR